MTESAESQPFQQRATLFRERAFFAGFASILFALGANGAFFLVLQGVSILRALSGWRETLLALVLLLAGAAVLAVTGPLLYGALQSLRLAWLMERQGRVTDGIVLDKYLRQNGSKRFYHLVFGPQAGARFDERISEAEYLRLNVGDAISLRTLPGHADIARLERTR